MYFSQRLWGSPVGSTLVVLDLIGDIELLEEPEDTLGSRVVEVMLRCKRDQVSARKRKNYQSLSSRLTTMSGAMVREVLSYRDGGNGT
jgi:hypothetical protein